jgi:hypothetical protein
MSYIGAQPTTASFPFDQFSGDGFLQSFTLSYAPAGSSSIIVTVAGAVQNPNSYTVNETILAFSSAPAAGTNNVTVLYLGLPSIAVATAAGNSAYRISTDYTAGVGQVTFNTIGTYTVGYLEVYRNGVHLGSVDYTATTGYSVTLNNACSGGDLITIVYYKPAALVDAFPSTGGYVTGDAYFSASTYVRTVGLVGGFADNDTYDIGATGAAFRAVYATTFYGKATTAQYADLAERFATDAEYLPGTLVKLGGVNEVTQENAAASESVFGVVSTDPAYLMNSEAGSDSTHPAIAMVGRVPVRVVGTAKKGDRLVSAGNGCARVAAPGEATAFNVIGRILGDKNSQGEELIEATVRIN